MLTQGDRHFARRLILYDEDATLGPRIAAGVEDNPRWELIALCATLDDLSFVLNRVTVDALLLHLTPESSGRVLSVASGLARDARILVLFQSGVRRQMPGAKRPPGGRPRIPVLRGGQGRRVVGPRSEEH